MSQAIKIREAKLEDVAFIMATWLRSFYSDMKHPKPPRAMYFKNHHQIIEFNQHRFNAWVACSETDEDLIFGYLVFDENSIIQFGYIKEVYRKLGIFTKLVKHLKGESKDLEYSHHTKDCYYFSSKYNLIFNPYSFYGAHNE